MPIRQFLFQRKRRVGLNKFCKGILYLSLAEMKIWIKKENKKKKKIARSCLGWPRIASAMAGYLSYPDLVISYSLISPMSSEIVMLVFYWDINVWKYNYESHYYHGEEITPLLKQWRCLVRKKNKPHKAGKIDATIDTHIFFYYLWLIRSVGVLVTRFTHF